MKKMMKRRKLLAFTDTKIEIGRRKSQFKRRGYSNLLVKSGRGGYALLGKKR